MDSAEMDYITSSLNLSLKKYIYIWGLPGGSLGRARNIKAQSLLQRPGFRFQLGPFTACLTHCIFIKNAKMYKIKTNDENNSIITVIWWVTWLHVRFKWLLQQLYSDNHVFSPEYGLGVVLEPWAGTVSLSRPSCQSQGYPEEQRRCSQVYILKYHE